MSDSPSVGAVILGWNLCQETVACAESLLEQGYARLRLIFVDNGSTDGSPRILRERFPEAEIIALSENQGIAVGYNRGLERALALGLDFAFILNNDTLFAFGALRELVDAAAGHPEAGVLMPKILYEADRSRIWSVGARRRLLPPSVVHVGLNQPDGPAYAEPRNIEYAPSCALLLRRRTLESTGLFDPEYFFYFDDWDYSDRVRASGDTIRYVPSAVVYHKVSMSTARSSRPARWWFVMGRSAVRYYRLHFPPWRLTLPAYVGWFALRELIQGNGRFLPLFAAGLRAGLVSR